MIRVSLQAWLALFALAITLWFSITYIGLIVELTWILFGAFLLGLAMHPLAERFARWRIPRGLTVLLIYALLIGIVLWIGDLLIPVIGSELMNLRSDGPMLWQTLKVSLGNIPVLQHLPTSSALTTDLLPRLEPLLATALATLTGGGRLLIDLLITLILAYFYATESKPSGSSISQWFPPQRRPRIQLLLAGIQAKLARWIWAQVGLAAIVHELQSG